MAQESKLRTLPIDWRVVRLGDIGETLIGLTYDPIDVKAFGTLVLRSSNIQQGTLAFDDCVYVGAAIPDRIRVREGDILICVRNGSRALIGKCALLDSRVAGETFGAFMAVFRTADPAFVHQVFSSEVIKRQIGEHIGATINQITNKNLNEFRIPFPEDPNERKLIAAALSDADALTGRLSALLSKKQDLKLAAAQQLLSGRTRLPGFGRTAWKEMSLGELGHFLKGSGVKRDEATSGSQPCVRYGELYTQHHDVIRAFSSWISPSVAKVAVRLRKGDILFAASGETKEEIGKCAAFTSEEEAYAGGDILILRPEQADSVFLGYYLNTPAIAAQKASRGQGDAVVHISRTSLSSILIRVPEFEEQCAIARVVATLDAEIASLQMRRQKCLALKQGMMQQLLTGRIRLI